MTTGRFNWLRGLPGDATRLDKRVRRLNQDLTSVHETTRLLTGPMDLPQVLEIVVKTVADALGADAAGLRLLDDDTGELVLKATYGLSEAYQAKGPVTAIQDDLNMRVLNGEVVVVNDMRTDPRFHQYHDEIVREGLVSNLSIGLVYHEKGIGILRIYSKRPRRFSKTDISLAQTIAAQSAAAIVNARLYRDALEKERMERQVRLAGAVQRHLIPTAAPSIPGYDIAGQYVPCYEVGGDLYDFIERPAALVVTIGDIMGKGLPASLAMASVRSSLRAYAEFEDDVAALVSRVNRMFAEDTRSGEFATLFCARLDLRINRLSYCNGGHNFPLVLRGDDVWPLSEGGLVLGLSRETTYNTGEIELLPGDFLLMYTDGLAEAANFEGEPFGVDRIIEAARASRDMSADAAAKNILWLMRKFAGLNRRCDDTALVVLKRQSVT